MMTSAASLPRVSVIIPTFNRAGLLPETLQSVLEQTFTDFEVLVVDDGSTDSTEQVVKQIQDPRIIYIRQPHSGLPAVARNAGLRRARGEYIAFLDSDDLWLPHKLAVQVQYMDCHPEVALTYTNTYRFTGDPERCDPHPMLSPTMVLSGYVFDRLYGNQAIPNLTVILRAAVVAEVGLFDPDPRLKANEDFELWLRIAYCHPIAYIAEPLAKYRHHAQGISKASLATNQSKLFLINKLDQMWPDFVAHHPGKRRRWLARIHYALGRSLLREQRVPEARYHLKRSLAVLPNLAASIFLVASFFGKPLYQRLDGVKTRLRNYQKLSGQNDKKG